MFWGHGPEFWTTVGTWAYVVLTAVLALLAGLAYRASKAQLRAQLRPCIHIPRSQPIQIRDGGLTILVRVENVGPGPALGVTIAGWIRVASPVAEAEFAAAIENLKSSVSIGSPELGVRISALGPQQHVEVPLSRAPGFRIDVYGAIPPMQLPDGTVLVYTAYYRDAFGGKFPRKRALRAKDLGHVLITPVAFAATEPPPVP